MSDVKKRIIDYDTITETDEDYYLLVDHGTEGTFKIPIKLAGPIEKIGNGSLAVGNDIIDAINTLDTSLTHKIYNKNGNTSVDLKPYNTDANMYVFPNDGYVTVNSGTGITAGTYIRLAIRSQDGYNIGYIYMIVQGAYQISSLFVRKGTKALFAGSNATNAYSVTYYPLNS